MKWFLVCQRNGNTFNVTTEAPPWAFAEAMSPVGLVILNWIQFDDKATEDGTNAFPVLPAS